MKQIDDTISITELKAMSDRMYGSLVKADVGLVRSILVVDMDMHADGEAFYYTHNTLTCAKSVTLSG